MSTPLSAETFQPLDDPDPATPADPLLRLRYHYGQLLGAEDFTTEQHYFVLRRRLHNAWLNGLGTVWGLRVSTVQTSDPPGLRLNCEPGMAIDALGREVFVPERTCLDITGLAATPFWGELSPPAAEVEDGDAEAPADEVDAPVDEGEVSGDDGDGGPEPEPEPEPETLVRRVYVVLEYRACLTDPVPAVTPPCSDSSASMVQSRIRDGYRLCLAAEAPADPAETQRAITRFTDPVETRARLLEFVMSPPVAMERFWSGQDQAPLLLAVLDLEPIGDPPEGMALVGALDNGVRAILPHCQAVAELALGVRLDGTAGASETRFQAAGVSAEPGADAVSMRLVVTTSATPVASTLDADSVQVLRLDPDTGWGPVPVGARNAIPNGIEVLAGEAWTEATTYQVMLSGTGEHAVADDHGRLLAGVAGDLVPAGSGRDAHLSARFQPDA